MAFSLILEGTVQGVGCRYYCSQVARRMRLTGTATNLRDGTVEVLLQTEDHSSARQYGENLRINRYNFPFYGNIKKITVSPYEGNFKGDYSF